jgi:hypothetical protein
MNDDDIIRQRVSGRSVRAIAQDRRCSVAQVNEVIDRWAANGGPGSARKEGRRLFNRDAGSRR